MLECSHAPAGPKGVDAPSGLKGSKDLAMGTKRLLSGVVVASLALVLSGCVNHNPVPVFRSRIAIGDRGIFVPLPPPSFTENPVQNAILDGRVDASTVVAGTRVVVQDLQGSADAELVLDEGQFSFEVPFEVDLRDNCVDVWLETDEGLEGSHRFLRVQIVSETELETVLGCDKP